MSPFKITWLRKSINWHRSIAWIGGIGLLIFIISAMTHPLMSWTGPKQSVFFPPQMAMDSKLIENIPVILKKYNLQKALIIKVVPSQGEPLLQVTANETQPRRYFDLISLNEKENYDAIQAEWLARYYTSQQKAPIRAIHFQSEFDASYPWVNRLLPVYKIEFDTKDNLTAFVYTELNVLASLTNDWKNILQNIFRNLHTWSWLDNSELVRVGIMIIFLSSIAALLITGISMILLMKRRKILAPNRRWHRYIAYIIWIPLLGLVTSGGYHLLHHSFTENIRGLRIGHPIDLNSLNLASNISLKANTPLNEISLIAIGMDKFAYRLSMPQGKPGEMIEHDHRFHGATTEKSAMYIDALSGKKIVLTDKELAIQFTNNHLGLNEEDVTRTELITHFGTLYDFRNKRLPVWRIDYGTEIVFIDAATGILVDRLQNKERYEATVFSYLHKWNFLVPIMGRESRDIVTIVILIFTLALSLLGLKLSLKRKLHI
ncbi:MAG: hypothetical protein V4629_04455 [Pseudomonadota bacterium]